MFSAKLTFWKQLALAFQYLGTAPSQHRDGFFITQSLSVSHSYRCLVAYIARSIDRRCTQPDWDAAAEQFSLLFFLWLLSDKRGAEISQKLHQNRGTDQQNRRSTAELEQLSTAGHVCSRGNLPNIILLFVEAKVESSTSKQTLS